MNGLSVRQQSVDARFLHKRTLPPALGINAIEPRMCADWCLDIKASFETESRDVAVGVCSRESLEKRINIVLQFPRIAKGEVDMAENEYSRRDVARFTGQCKCVKTWLM